MNWLSFLRGSFGVDDLVVASATLFVLMALAAVWHGLVVRDPMAGRVKALAERRNALRSAARTRQNRARNDLRSSGISLMRQAVLKLKLMRGGHVEHVAMRLARAGWRSRDAVIIYLFAKAILPIMLCGGALLFFSVTTQSSLTPMLRIVIAMFLGFIGLFGTDIWVKNVAERRVKEMTKAMPDALDLLVICAEAGLSLDAALTRVGREIAVTSPVLAEEFSLTAIELGFLPSRQAALNNLINRTNMANLRALVNSLIQTERYGTPLANALRVLSAEFRNERMMRAEEKAAKLPAKMTVPMIVFIMPALFIVLGGPAIIQVMHTFSHGG
jgi:tight adherence protein C